MYYMIDSNEASNDLVEREQAARNRERREIQRVFEHQDGFLSTLVSQLLELSPKSNNSTYR